MAVAWASSAVDVPCDASSRSVMSPRLLAQRRKPAQVPLWEPGRGGQAGRAPRRAKYSTRAGKASMAGLVAKLCTAGVAAQGSVPRVQNTAKGANQTWTWKSVVKATSVSVSVQATCPKTINKKNYHHI